MDDDKIINFPGAHQAKPGAAAAKPAAKPKARRPEQDPPADAAAAAAQALEGLSEDQRKAVQIALSGMSFVLIGLKPTPSGADFFTAVHGDATDLRNAHDHLAGVIERAFARKGI
jgi:hypothetical protein